DAGCVCPTSGKHRYHQPRTLNQAATQGGGTSAEGLPEDDLVCEQYDQLQRRYLLSDVEGRRSLVSAIRHQHLMQPVHESEEVMPQTALVRVSGAAYVPITLRVMLPPVSLEAHRQELRLNFVQGTERTFGFLPMVDVLEYRKRTHSLVALAPLHRWSRNPGQAVQVTYGDWFCADGYGRALYAAAVSGLVVRRGESANGMGGVSPMFALTRAGRRAQLATEPAWSCKCL
ncbi:hypothetical protein FHR65_004485, partial [Xanthomonas arboricola]|nr:hypothetical protein [Xanthomonas arboricola]